jgi:hypothetical protein
MAFGTTCCFKHCLARHSIMHSSTCKSANSVPAAASCRNSASRYRCSRCRHCTASLSLPAASASPTAACTRMSGQVLAMLRHRQIHRQWQSSASFQWEMAVGCGIGCRVRAHCMQDYLRWWKAVLVRSCGLYLDAGDHIVGRHLVIVLDEQLRCARRINSQQLDCMRASRLTNTDDDSDKVQARSRKVVD